MLKPALECLYRVFGKEVEIVGTEKAAGRPRKKTMKQLLKHKWVKR